MGLLSAPRAAIRLGFGAVRTGTRIATLPARASVGLTLVIYEELLDVAERAALVEPPDPPARTLTRPGRRRPAA